MIIYDILLILQYQVNYCDVLGRCFRFASIYAAVFLYKSLFTEKNRSTQKHSSVLLPHFRWIKIYIKAYHLAKRSSQVSKMKGIFFSSSNMNCFCKQLSQASGSKNVITVAREICQSHGRLNKIVKQKKWNMHQIRAATTICSHLSTYDWRCLSAVW